MDQLDSDKRFCGIDPSLTGTGIVVIDAKGEVEFQSEVAFKTQDNFALYTFIYDYFTFLYEGDTFRKIDAFGVEGLAFMAKGNTLTRLAELGAIIRLVVAQHNIPTYIFAPQNVKKYVAGKIKKKDEMRLEVFKRWGFEDKSNNIVDAFAIAQYTRTAFCYLNGYLLGDDIKKCQTEALTAWLKNENGAWIKCEGQPTIQKNNLKTPMMKIKDIKDGKNVVGKKSKTI